MPCQSRPAISFARDAPDREARTVGRLPSRAKRLLGERQSSDCFQPRRERVAHPITASVRGQFAPRERSEEHTSELQSLMRISYAVFCLKKKNTTHYNKYQVYYKNKHKNTISKITD